MDTDSLVRWRRGGAAATCSHRLQCHRPTKDVGNEAPMIHIGRKLSPEPHCARGRSPDDQNIFTAAAVQGALDQLRHVFRLKRLNLIIITLCLVTWHPVVCISLLSRVRVPQENRWIASTFHVQIFWWLYTELVH